MVTDPSAAVATLTPPPLAHMALWTLTCALGCDEDGSDELALLRSCLPHDATARTTDWQQRLMAALEGACHPWDRRLLRLSAPLALHPIEILAAALAQGCEGDLVVGRTLAHLQRPVGGSRPSLGLLDVGLSQLCDRGRAPLDVLLEGTALRCGLLVTLFNEAPLVERCLAMPAHTWAILRGLRPTRTGLQQTPRERDVPLPTRMRDKAEALACSLLAPDRGLVIRAASIEEGRAAARLVADALDRTPLLILDERCDDLAPWLLVEGCLPVFVRSLAPSERATIPVIPAYRGPRIVVTGPDGQVELAEGSALTWRLGVPDIEGRAQLWRGALGDPDLSDVLAHDHRHGAHRIAALGATARQRADVEGRAPGLQDVLEATLESETAGLDGYAERVSHRVEGDGLVLPDTVQRDLNTLLLRCRTRELLHTHLGKATRQRYGPGVRALFVGESGTGKTLCAAWLATELGLPLYRVEVASIISKYIGETEKNLSILLARAEHAEVVLLFDEADSLFGKRTEVKQANDRFANTQTNYLLQRIESYEGVVVLTSNARTRFDSAFTRRLDFIVDFRSPQPRERRSLWVAHLGEQHDLSSGQLNQLAATCDLVGGHIRNAVLTAAVLAHAEQCPIGWSHVLSGVESEYRKLGKQPPSALLAGAGRGQGG